MRARLGFPAAVVLGVALWLPALAGGATSGQEITVTNYGDMEPVRFDHTGHAARMECERCHHTKSAGGSHRCGACHFAQRQGAALSLEDAAHGDGVGKCWGCHLKDKVEKALDCEDCHRE